MGNHKLLLFVFLPVLLLSATPSKTVKYVATDKTLNIQSEILREVRPIQIHLPATYHRSTKKYRVIYLLDGKYYFPKCKNIANILCKKKAISEIIIVAIHNINTITRLRDYYDTKESDAPAGGGANQFLEFIKDELIPYIDRKYRTTSNRAFFGHSSGGYLVVYTLLKMPEIFGGYIASSPALHWDKNVIIKKASDILKRSKRLKKYLHIGLASDDIPVFQKAVKKFISLLKKIAPTELKWKLVNYENEDHFTLPDRCLSDGLKHYFYWLKKF